LKNNYEKCFQQANVLINTVKTLRRSFFRTLKTNLFTRFFNAFGGISSIFLRSPSATRNSRNTFVSWNVFFSSYFRVPHWTFLHHRHWYGQTSPCCELWKRREGRYTRKQSHVIDILTSEDMENMSLCISQYLTLYYIINRE
jgi:hypothetical protein